MKDPAILYHWGAAGFFVQVNAGTVIRGGRQAKLIRKLLKWNLIQVISSDVHSIEHRPPNIEKGLHIVKESIGKDVADRLLQNGDCIFDGDLPDIMDIHYPKKFLGSWI